MDSLASNPSGSGIYGQQPRMTDDNALGLMHQVRDRELRDFKDKANFMSDLSLKQDRMRSLFNPNKPNPQQGQNMDTQGMNVVMAHDPNQMTGYEKGQLGIRQQEIGVDKQRLAQQGKLGQSALDIRDAQQQLNQQKSDQIHAQKQDDMDRKSNEAAQKFAAMQAELERKTKIGKDTLQLHKDMMAQSKQIHDLEMARKDLDSARKDKQFEDIKELHAAQIKKMEEDATNAKESETTTEENADGTKKVVTTKKGDNTGTVNVTGKDGKSYTIPKNKLDDWNKNHKPGEQ